MAKKTPSPKQIAAILILGELDQMLEGIPAATMAETVDSKVSEEKRLKVIEQAGKILAPLVVRLQKIVAKLESEAPADG